MSLLKSCSTRQVKGPYGHRWRADGQPSVRHCPPDTLQPVKACCFHFEQLPGSCSKDGVNINAHVVTVTCKYGGLAMCRHGIQDGSSSTLPRQVPMQQFMQIICLKVPSEVAGQGMASRVAVPVPAGCDIWARLQVLCDDSSRAAVSACPFASDSIYNGSQTDGDGTTLWL